jgi:hypothetical protein
MINHMPINQTQLPVLYPQPQPTYYPQLPPIYYPQHQMPTPINNMYYPGMAPPFMQVPPNMLMPPMYYPSVIQPPTASFMPQQTNNGQIDILTTKVNELSGEMAELIKMMKGELVPNGNNNRTANMAHIRAMINKLNATNSSNQPEPSISLGSNSSDVQTLSDLPSKSTGPDSIVDTVGSAINSINTALGLNSEGSEGSKPEAQTEGSKPDGSEGSKPEAQTEGSKHDAQTEGSKPDAQTEGVKPDAQTEGVKPDAQTEGVKPDAQTEGVKPDAQTEGSKPNTTLAVVEPKPDELSANNKKLLANEAAAKAANNALKIPETQGDTGLKADNMIDLEQYTPQEQIDTTIDEKTIEEGLASNKPKNTTTTLTTTTANKPANKPTNTTTQIATTSSINKPANNLAAAIGNLSKSSQEQSDQKPAEQQVLVGGGGKTLKKKSSGVLASMANVLGLTTTTQKKPRTTQTGKRGRPLKNKE